MAQPIIIQDTALRNYLRTFQPIFGIPQWKYFVTVLMGLIHCQASRTLSGLLREVAVVVSVSGLSRFLKKADLKTALMRLYQEDAEFVIGDPTEMERYKAPKTPYVGTLKDGKTAGYWLLVLSTPFRGRSLPCSFVVYSSRTIGDQCTSRNQEHFRCFDEVKQLLGDRHW